MNPEHHLLDNSTTEKIIDNLFHSWEYFNLHRKNNGHFYEWSKKGTVVGHVHFTEIQAGIWRSPARGTFSGFHFANNLKLEDQFQFYDEVENALKTEGAKELEILLPPMSHSTMEFSNQIYLLHSKGFEISRCDLNYSLNIDERDFFSHISYGNQKRLRKSAAERLKASQLDHSFLPQVYETLAINREGKGNTLSMTLEQLQEMVTTFPDKFQLFGVWDNSILAAASICIRISPDILYVFYWGDIPGYSNTSPVVTIAENIYNYCHDNKIKLMDIGTSTINEVANFGLINFKKGLGFNESLKVCMIKNL